jgi:hypothetical protein
MGCSIGTCVTPATGAAAAAAAAGLNYFQSVTPNLSAGGEVFWLPQQMRSGVGLCLRHQGEKHIAAMQLATTGILSAQYAHRVTDKVCVCVCVRGGREPWAGFSNFGTDNRSTLPWLRTCTRVCHNGLPHHLVLVVHHKGNVGQQLG